MNDDILHDETVRRSEPTTTHAAWGAGNPHLIVRRGEERSEFPLTQDLTRIGSAGDAELRLEGTSAVHAEIRHDDNDEYVLRMIGAGDMGSTMLEEVVESDGKFQILRQGAQFTAGPWTFVFMREEYADHGRPYGGREGGEGAVQPTQPERPDYGSNQQDGGGEKDPLPTDEERDHE